MKSDNHSQYVSVNKSMLLRRNARSMHRKRDIRECGTLRAQLQSLADSNLQCSKNRTTVSFHVCSCLKPKIATRIQRISTCYSHVNVLFPVSFPTSIVLHPKDNTYHPSVSLLLPLLFPLSLCQQTRVRFITENAFRRVQTATTSKAHQIIQRKDDLQP